MKVFHIDQFKCTLCNNWFCPPFNLPYRLKCTHSICTNCLEKSVQNHSNQIICPEDLERNQISEINVNQSTKKALQRLLKEHKNFTQTNHLECIKSLSLNFDQLLDQKQIELKNLSTLMDQIFENEIKRLRQIYQKIKIQINRPFRIVNDWKQVVRNYLKKVKTTGPNLKGCVNQLNHYIEEGRKIKLDLNQYLKYNFKDLIDYLISQPQVCFTHNFSIFNNIERQISSMNQKQIAAVNQSQFKKFTSFNTLNTFNKNQYDQMEDSKQIYLQDLTNNLDQSSIRMNKKSILQGQHNQNYNKLLPRDNNEQNSNNKMSLFEELIQETPKNNRILKNPSSNSKFSGLQSNKDSKKTPLKQLIFTSGDNNKNIDVYHQHQQVDVQKSKSKQKCKKRNESINKNNIKKNSQLQRNGEQSSINKDYNKVIKEKIKNLKSAQINCKAKGDEASMIDMNKKYIANANKLGKSLQYSPEAQQYRHHCDQLQKYSIQDSFHQDQIKHLQFDPINTSLGTYYQESTTLIKPTSIVDRPFDEQNEQQNNFPTKKNYQNKAISSTFNNSRNLSNYNNLTILNNQYEEQNLLQDKSNRKSFQSMAIKEKNNWQLENLNFLKEWKVNRNNKIEEELQIIQKYGGYDCEKQKNRYIRKIQQNKVRQILTEMVINQNYIELVGHSLADCSISLLLSQINWSYLNIQIVKFIKTSLNDHQLNQLLNYLARSNVHTLMLSYNNLTELSLDALLNFCQINTKVKNIYLPKNNISLLKGNSRAKMNLLKEKGINLYI